MTHVEWQGRVDEAELQRALEWLGIRGQVYVARSPATSTGRIASDGRFHEILVAAHKSACEANETLLHELAHAHDAERGLLVGADEPGRYLEHDLCERRACYFAADHADEFKIAVDGPPSEPAELTATLRRLDALRAGVEAMPFREARHRRDIENGLQHVAHGLRRAPYETRSRT